MSEMRRSDRRIAGGKEPVKRRSWLKWFFAIPYVAHGTIYSFRESAATLKDVAEITEDLKSKHWLICFRGGPADGKTREWLGILPGEIKVKRPVFEGKVQWYDEESGAFLPVKDQGFGMNVHTYRRSHTEPDGLVIYV